MEAEWCLFWAWPCLSSQVWAAWAQVLVLVVSIGLAYWAGHRDHERSIKTENQRLETKRLAVTISLYRTAFAIGNDMQIAINQVQSGSCGQLRLLTSCGLLIKGPLEFLARIPVYDVPETSLIDAAHSIATIAQAFLLELESELGDVTGFDIQAFTSSAGQHLKSIRATEKKLLEAAMKPRYGVQIKVKPPSADGFRP